MTKPTPLALSVTRLIAARPETIYDLISDITRMSEFSAETTSTQWLSGADHAEVGARFKGTNAIGRTRWSTKPTITAADRGRRFAFKVPGRSGPEWSYRFTATEGGTQVTESMSQMVPSPALIRGLRRAAGVTDRAEHLRQGMITTLDRLAAAAVASQADLAQR